VDVGANHGLYSYVLSRLGHEVVAFEPQPWCAETLKAWARGRVRVYDVGLSDHAGTFGLHIPSAGGVRFTGHATFDAIADPGETVQVPVLRLDDFELPGLTFVKIDVEGHEMQVLAGAEQTIKRAMPVLLIEIGAVHRSDAEVLETFERVCGLGYRGEFLLNGRWRPLTEYSIERYQRASLDGDPSAPYVYNFVFRPLTS
jgi:FkbM family methyltransferase